MAHGASATIANTTTSPTMAHGASATSANPTTCPTMAHAAVPPPVSAAATAPLMRSGLTSLSSREADASNTDNHSADSQLLPGGLRHPLYDIALESDMAAASCPTPSTASASGMTATQISNVASSIDDVNPPGTVLTSVSSSDGRSGSIRNSSSSNSGSSSSRSSSSIGLFASNSSGSNADRNRGSQDSTRSSTNTRRIGSSSSSSSSNSSSASSSSPFSSLRWLCLEFAILLAQIVAIVAVLCFSAHETPAAPLRLWLIGYMLGCLMLLPLLTWRYAARLARIEAMALQPDTVSEQERGGRSGSRGSDGTRARQGGATLDLAVSSDTRLLTIREVEMRHSVVEEGREGLRGGGRAGGREGLHVERAGRVGDGEAAMEVRRTESSAGILPSRVQRMETAVDIESEETAALSAPDATVLAGSRTTSSRAAGGDGSREQRGPFRSRRWSTRLASRRWFVRGNDGSGAAEARGLWMMQAARRLAMDTRLAAFLDLYKAMLDWFFAAWFVLGNVWVFGGQASHEDAPTLFSLCVALLLLCFLSYAMPFILCAALCCCLPCIIAFVGIDEDDAGAAGKGAAAEVIQSLPSFVFQVRRPTEGAEQTREKGGGNEQGPGCERKGSIREDDDDDNDDDDDDVAEVGLLWAGTAKESVVVGEDAICCICLAHYREGEELRQLPCNHHFHVSCVDTWLKINACCPLCKAGISASS